MPGWDIKKDWIHYRIREPSLFVSKTFRTVKISDGIESVMGILESNRSGGMVAQNIMFSTKKFTLEEAKKWYKEHNFGQ